MDKRSRPRLSDTTLRRMRLEADRDLHLVHDSPRREAFPPRRSRPMRPSRHDVEWKDVEPAVNRPMRAWDRPMPRPMGKKGRTHGRRRKRMR